MATAATPCGDTLFPKQSPVELEKQYFACNGAFHISRQDAHKLEHNTCQQNKCKLWFNERQKHLTSSSFGKVCKRKKDINSIFLKSLFEPRAFSTEATSYGISHEIQGKKAYCDIKKNVHIHDCGLVVNPQFSFLGASPDGKICDELLCGVLEVKCPYAARDMTVKEAILKVKNFCLKQEGEIILNPKHVYYYQVQGQLMITGAPFCDFVVFTKKDVHIQRILPDKNFMSEMLLTLAKFYAVHAMPFLNLS